MPLFSIPATVAVRVVLNLINQKRLAVALDRLGGYHRGTPSPQDECETFVYRVAEQGYRARPDATMVFVATRRGSPKIWLPVVVTFPVSVVVPPALVVSEASAVPPPTAAPKVVAPVVFTTRVKPPLTVEVRRWRRPHAVSAVADVRLTASLRSEPPWWSRSRRCSWCRPRWW